MVVLWWFCGGFVVVLWWFCGGFVVNFMFGVMGWGVYLRRKFRPMIP